MARARRGGNSPQGDRKPSSERPAAPGAADELASVTQFYTYRLHRLSALLSRQMHDELQARYGFGLAEWRTIAVLGEFGVLSLRDVARHASIDKAQVSRLLPKLIRPGYIVREPHPSDRRRASLRLTEAGRRLHGEILVLGRRRQDWLAEALNSHERSRLVGYLDRLLAKVEAEPFGPFARRKEME